MFENRVYGILRNGHLNPLIRENHGKLMIESGFLGHPWVSILGTTLSVTSAPFRPTFQHDLWLLRLGATEASHHGSRLIWDLLHIGADENHGILVHLAKYLRDDFNIFQLGLNMLKASAKTNE